MGKNKQLVINLSAEIISFISSCAINFFLTPFVVGSIGEEAYGFIGLANNFISIATVITVALNSMASRFITISIHRGEDEETNRYFSSLLAANTIMCMGLGAAFTLVLVFLDKIVNVSDDIRGDVTLLWIFLFANFLLGLIGTAFNIATFAKNRLELSSIASIASNLLRAAVIIIAYVFFRPQVFYFGVAALLRGIITIAANAGFTRKLLPDIKFSRKYIDAGKIKTLVMSGGWNSLSKVGGVLATGLDLLLANWFIDASTMGVVSISKTIPSLIITLFATMAAVFFPQLMLYYAKNEFEDLKKELTFSIKVLGFFSSAAIACLWGFGREFFTLWVPGQDAGLLHILTILASGAYPFSLMLEPLWNVFTLTNKVKVSSLYLLANSILSIIVVLIWIPLVSDDNMRMYIIVGFSTTLSIIRALTFLPMYSAHCLGYKIGTFYPPILKNVLSLTMMLVMSSGLKMILPADSWLTLFADFFIIAAAACVINFFLLLNKEERRKFVALILRRK